MITPQTPKRTRQWYALGLKGTHGGLAEFARKYDLGCRWWIEDLPGRAILWMVDYLPFGFRTIEETHSGSGFKEEWALVTANGAHLCLGPDISKISDMQL